MPNPDANPTIGSLRRRARLVNPYASESRDPDGQPVAAPAAVATVWCSLVPVTGGETYLAAHVQSDVTHVLTMRHRDDVRDNGSRWRVEIGPRRFEGRQVLEHLGEVRFTLLFLSEIFTRPAVSP